MLAADALQAALAEVDLPAEDDVIARGKPIAERLCRFLEASRAESEIVELYSWAFNVEFVLNNGDYWAIECLSPDEFRMYPGFVRGDTVTWANIWVRDTNMSLDELVKDINNVAFREAKEEFQNA
jgi:hypothetical protein